MSQRCQEQKIVGFRGVAFHAPRNALDLSVQRRQYFSRGNEVDDWVLGVECVDDGAQARLTRLRAPSTCEN
jgi:hypothetical protein